MTKFKRADHRGRFWTALLGVVGSCRGCGLDVGFRFIRAGFTNTRRVLVTPARRRTLLARPGFSGSGGLGLNGESDPTEPG